MLILCVQVWTVTSTWSVLETSSVRTLVGRCRPLWSGTIWEPCMTCRLWWGHTRAHTSFLTLLSFAWGLCLFSFVTQHESEILPFPNTERSFSLPDDIIQEVKEGEWQCSCFKVDLQLVYPPIPVPGPYTDPYAVAWCSHPQKYHRDAAATIVIGLLCFTIMHFVLHTSRLLFLGLFVKALQRFARWWHWSWHQEHKVTAEQQRQNAHNGRLVQLQNRALDRAHIQP